MELDTAKKLKAIDDYAALNITRTQFYKILGADVYFAKKYAPDIRAAEQLRANTIKNRNLEVVYITGCSGSGKSTACKYFAEKLGFDDPFISGSGDDILDGYDKQQCIILDDFRGGTLKFSELLKFLDNNTNSAVASRYHNKDISACKLIFINSVKMPSELYSTFKEEEEPAEQLYRRLKHHFFKIEEVGDDMIIFEYSLNTNNVSIPTGKAIGSMANIYKEMGIDLNNSNNTSLLSQFMYKSKIQPLSEEERVIDSIF